MRICLWKLRTPICFAHAIHNLVVCNFSRHIRATCPSCVLYLALVLALAIVLFILSLVLDLLFCGQARVFAERMLFNRLYLSLVRLNN
jgi:hypothetical protein